ncbi:MAG: hypothetical protein JWO88_2714 [Frankiales bacterium]|nr:hypothetical protein [Frankiales bacterium]
MSETLTTRGVTAMLRLTGQPDVTVIALLRHSSETPSALRAVLVLDEEPMELVFDRAMLSAGLTAPVRDGDVAVSVAGTTAVLEVGPLIVLLGLADLVDVLLETYAAVPTDAERDLVINLTTTAQQLART